MTFINRNIVEKEINKIQNDTEFQNVVKNIKAGKFLRDVKIKMTELFILKS